MRRVGPTRSTALLVRSIGQEDEDLNVDCGLHDESNQDINHVHRCYCSHKLQFCKAEREREYLMMKRVKQCISVSELASFFCFFFLFFVPNAAQKLPPARFDGFVYENRKVHRDTIIIEAFFDPICPDSRDAWPSLKKALDFYGHQVRLVVHLLPLPYHDNAFVASRALHIINLENSSATFPLLEGFFNHQEQFYNAQTRNLSKTTIVEKIVKFAVKIVGDSNKESFVSGFNDRKTDLLTRISFKFSTSRGVYGTPFFFINGFLAPDNGSTVSFDGWKSFIDPLLGKHESWESMHFFL